MQDGVSAPTSHPELNRETAMIEGGTSDVPQLGANRIEEQQQNITFGDSDPAAPENIRIREDPTRFLRDDSIAHLGEYLSRPVMINSYQWTQAGTGNDQNLFLPWHLFFNDARIKNKLANFARIQCTLHLKFILNASPFYYGMLKVNYDPLASGRAVGSSFITQSQLPGPYILPQEMSSVEMTLPFFWPRDYLDVCSAADFQSMGSIYYNIFEKLQSANGANGAITISCYAWAEDIHLAAPTSHNPLQGPVSKVARRVSQVAGSLAKIPPLATIGSTISAGAGMVSDLATALGFSNSPNMANVCAVQVKTAHAFANTEQQMPLDKLSLDPKNEVSLDPSSAGLSDVDELAVNEFCAHEAMVAQCTWATTITSGTHLVSMFVTPCMQSVTSYANPSRTRYQMTPTRFLTRNFRFWRGSMIYRIKIIASQYHKGRLQVSWDPEDDASTATDTETTNITKIVDLDNECEIELIVPFKGVRTWNKTGWDSIEGMPVKYADGNYEKTPNKVEHNGALSIFVQNELSAPVDPSEVQVVIFARAGPDFEVAGPIHSARQYTHNVIQGPTTLDGSTLPEETKVTGFTVGERTQSIRQLLHRTSCYTIFPRLVKLASLADTRTLWCNSAFFPKMPRGFGYDVNDGLNWNFGISATQTAFRVNQVFETPLNSFTNCFGGYRGSVNWHVFPIFEDGNDQPMVSVARETDNSHIMHAIDTGVPNNQIQPLNMNQNLIAESYPQNFAAAYFTNSAAPVGGRHLHTAQGTGGISLGSSKIQPFVSVNVPQYFNVRFQPAWEPKRDIISGESIYDTIRVDHTQMTAATATRYSLFYTSAGVDFNLFYFVCCPPMWSYVLPAGGS